MRLLLLLCVLTAPGFASETYSLPEKTASCVAWRTRKRMFLVSSARPVGVNCDITSRRVETPQGKQIEVRAPIHKFSSGEPDRDKEVLDILKAGVQPDLLVRTAPLTSDPFDTESGTLAGELSIGGKTYPIEIPYRVEKAGQVDLVGVVKTTFTAFGIDPPVVGGGMVAKVYDELELHYRLIRDSIE